MSLLPSSSTRAGGDAYVTCRCVTVKRHVHRYCRSPPIANSLSAFYHLVRKSHKPLKRANGKCHAHISTSELKRVRMSNTNGGWLIVSKAVTYCLIDTNRLRWIDGLRCPSFRFFFRSFFESGSTLETKTKRIPVKICMNTPQPWKECKTSLECLIL